MTCKLIVDETFGYVKTSSTNKFVLFYKYDNTEEFKNTLLLLRVVAKKLRSEIPSLIFYKVDGSLEVNRKDYEESGFGDKLYLFTSNMELGIQKYIHAHDEQSILKHLRLIYYKTTMPNKVLTFKDEDDLYERIDLPDLPKPMFVKFYIDSCTHCKAFKESFVRFAELFRNQIQFMEINCELNAETKLFCSKNSASSYPTLVLFTVNEKISYSGEDRSIISMEKFFTNHIFNFQPALFGKDADSTNAANAKVELKTEVINDIAPEVEEVKKPVKKSSGKKKKDNRDEL